METPVKERLVGAVILVLLLAILVPELLSGPEHSQPAAAPDGQTAPTRTYTIDLSGQRPAPAKPVSAKPSAAPSPGPVAPSALPQPESSSTPTPTPTSAPTSAPTAAPKLAAAPSTASAPSPQPSGSGWTVQLGSFSKSENAERLVKELRAKHYQAFVSRTGTGAKTRYRVRVGPEEDRAQAQKLAERLKREGRQVSIIPQP